MPVISRIGAAAARGFGLFGKIAAAVDQYFENVTLLLPGNGTNGAQNNTFLDSSTNAFSITRNGNTTQGSFSPFSQTGWGNYLATTSERLTTSASSSGFSFGTGDFTIEGWVNLNESSNCMIFQMSTASTGYNASTSNTVAAYIGGGANAGKLEIYAANAGTASTNAVMASSDIGKWNHFAIVRSSGTTKAYWNGTAITGLSISDSTNYTMTYCVIGTVYNTSYALKGYLSNFRVVKGTAVYTGDFTPPTSPLTAITNTQFLISQSNRFIDNSTNAIGLTISGSPSIQAFSPFNPTASWSAATYGGSGYFDGSGDYLTATLTSQAPGTGDFTYQFWVYAADNTAVSLFDTRAVNNNTTGFTLLINSTSNLAIYTNSTILTGSGTVPLNAWSFVTVTRSGTTLTIYLDGTSQGTVTFSNNLTDTAMRLGQYVDGTGSFTGYIAGFKYVKGSADSASVPTTPPTATTGTQFLCNFTNAGIYDATSKNDLETVGNAQISTTQSKFGGSSMYFDGTGDYLKSNSSTPDLYAFGTGDFTIEMWIRVNSLPGTDMVVYDNRPSNGAYPCIILQGSTNKFIWYVNTSAQITSTNTVSTATWMHLAVCRSGTSTKMFLDGTQTGSTYTDSTNYLGSATRPYVGANSTNGNESLNGYINDLRVTKGIARYTANFTAPTAAFPLQ